MSMPTIVRTQNGNLTRVTTDAGTMWFSYETPVGFETERTGRIVAVNIWTPTTGKHLNEIDGGSAAAKAQRRGEAEFVALLGRAFAPAPALGKAKSLAQDALNIVWSAENKGHNGRPSEVRRIARELAEAVEAL